MAVIDRERKMSTGMQNGIAIPHGKTDKVDALIAAIALSHRATLVTRNLRHFRQVPELAVENWVD